MSMAAQALDSERALGVSGRGRPPLAVQLARDSLVRDMIAQNRTFDAIAQAAGLTSQGLRHVVKRLGVEPKAEPLRAESIRDLAARGYTRSAAAKALGITYGTLSKIAREAGIKFQHARHLKRKAASRRRAEQMAFLYREGMTLAQVGQRYGVTRERVRQMLKEHLGVTGDDGGQAIATQRRREMRQARRDKLSLEKHGCTFAQLRELRAIARRMEASGQGHDRTPIGAFCRQRQNARDRGIAWELKLWDWWQIWQRSGCWERRGRGQGKYVMARYGDTGPYAVDNVCIVPFVYNNSTANKKSDLPMGVALKPGGRYTSQIMIRGRRRCLGTFDTPEEAHQAYLNAARQAA